MCTDDIQKNRLGIVHGGTIASMGIFAPVYMETRVLN